MALSFSGKLCAYAPCTHAQARSARTHTERKHRTAQHDIAHILNTTHFVFNFHHKTRRAPWQCPPRPWNYVPTFVNGTHFGFSCHRKDDTDDVDDPVLELPFFKAKQFAEALGTLVGCALFPAKHRFRW